MSAVNIDPIVAQYRKAFADNGRGQSAVLCPKGRQPIRYAAMLKGFALVNQSILDYGCGLAHLYEYLLQNAPQCSYRGVDIVPEFIDDNAKRFAGAQFSLIAGIDDVQQHADIVIASGVFNLRYVADPVQNQAFVYSQIARLFELSKLGVCVDFLSNYVDFQAPGAFHIAPGEVLRFVHENLSRRAIVDHAYLPYEYCVTVYKDDAIDRAQSIYGNPDGRDQQL